ncbi:MAG: hypothetical protein Q8O82_10075 [Pseudorhodobacter sp.]|nr:hypothetical protein [Pseudorhodobacter sp.]
MFSLVTSRPPRRNDPANIAPHGIDHGYRDAVQKPDSQLALLGFAARVNREMIRHQNLDRVPEINAVLQKRGLTLFLVPLEGNHRTILS